MREKVNVVMCFLISLSIIFIPNTASALTESKNTNENGVLITETQKNNLISLGLTENELISLTQEELDFYNNFLGTATSQVKYIRTTTIYAGSIEDDNILDIVDEEISKEEYENTILTTGDLFMLSPSIMKKVNRSILLSRISKTYETAAKKLTVSTANGIASGQTLITALLEWKNAPKVRSYDVFAIRSNYKVLRPESRYARATARYKTVYANCDAPMDQTFYTSYNSSKGLWKLGSGDNLIGHDGIGITFDALHGSIYGCFDNLTSLPILLHPILSSRISVVSDSPSAGRTETINVTYQHATTGVSKSNSYNFVSGYLGNTIHFTNGYDSKYDGMGGISLNFTSR